MRCSGLPVWPVLPFPLASKPQLFAGLSSAQVLHGAEGLLVFERTSRKLVKYFHKGKKGGGGGGPRREPKGKSNARKKLGCGEFPRYCPGVCFLESEGHWSFGNCVRTQFSKFLGVDSPLCSTIVLSKPAIFLGVLKFSRKKDAWKEWGRYP